MAHTPDLGDVRDPIELGALLTSLRHQQNLTIRGLSRTTGIPVATLGGYFAGKHLPLLSNPGQVTRFLTGLGVDEAEHEAWFELVRRLRDGRGRADRVPYKGLASYGVEDAALFFGREELTRRVLDMIRRAEEPGARRVVTVIGSSGSGKSSLVRAGVVAAEQRRRPVLVTSPGTWAREDLEPGTLVVLDQLEEAFSPAWTDEQRSDLVTTLVDLPDEATLLLVLRADFLARVLQSPKSADLLGPWYVLVGPLEGDALARVVEEPCRAVDRPMEPGLVELILRDAAPMGSRATEVLPLLSHTLLRTWERSGSRRMDVASYTETGGLAGSIAATAEEAYRQLSAPQREKARHAFAHLVNLNEDGARTRRHAPLSEFDTDERGVVEVFVAERILTAHEDSVTMTHEAVLAAWPRLARWIEEEADALRLRRRVGLLAQEWQEAGNPDDLLLRGAMLEAAHALTDHSGPVAVQGADRTFVEMSRRHADTLEAGRRRRRVILSGLTAVVAVLAVVAVSLSVMLAGTLRMAKTQRDEALSRELAVEARAESLVDPAVAARLAVAAYHVSPTVEARSALLDATVTDHPTRLLGPAGSMVAIGSPDGRLLATAYAGGRVALTPLTPAGGLGRSRMLVVKGAGDFYSAAFLSDDHLVVAGSGGTLTEVADTGGRPQVVSSTKVPSTDASDLTSVTSLALAPGGRLLAGVGDGRVLAFATGPWRVVASRTLGTGAVQALATSADRTYAGVTDGSLHVLTGAGLRPSYQRSLSADPIDTIAVAPGGRTIAVGGQDALLRTLPVTARGLGRPRVLAKFPSWVNGATFSSDGSRLAATGSNGAVRTWAGAHLTPAADYPGPTNYTSAAFLGHTHQLVTGSIDGTARIFPATPATTTLPDKTWQFSATGSRMTLAVGSTVPAVVDIATVDGLDPRVQPVSEPAAIGDLDGVSATTHDGSTLVLGSATGGVAFLHRTPTGWHQYAALRAASQLIEYLAVSPDDQLAAATADDGTVTILSLGARPRVLQTLHVRGLGFGVAFSPHTHLLAAGSSERQVRVWRMDGTHATPYATLSGFHNYVYSLAFDPRGTTLAVAGADPGITLWRMAGRRSARVGPTMTGASGIVYGLAFDPGGTRLAAADQDKSIYVWSVSQAEHPALLEQLQGLADSASWVDFLSGGNALAAVGSDGSAALWRSTPTAAIDSLCRSTGSRLTAAEWRKFAPGTPGAPPTC